MIFQTEIQKFRAKKNSKGKITFSSACCSKCICKSEQRQKMLPHLHFASHSRLSFHLNIFLFAKPNVIDNECLESFVYLQLLTVRSKNFKQVRLFWQKNKPKLMIQFTSRLVSKAKVFRLFATKKLA